MRALDTTSFEKYLRGQWSPAGYSISDASDAPYKEMVKSLPDGFSFGLMVAHGGGEDQNAKTRVGVWFRPAPKGSINDLAPLRSHYQGRLQQQGRGCRIHNCATEFGSLFLFYETTAPLPQAAFSEWVRMIEELSGLCFDSNGLDDYLAAFR